MERSHFLQKANRRQWPFHHRSSPYKKAEGDLLSRAQKLVLEWATLYQQDILQIWNTQEFRKLPPLK